VKGEYKPIQACHLDFFLLKIYSLFMLLFIHLLYLILGKTLCFNCLRGTLRLWCWCSNKIWVWYFLRTLQSNSPFALY